MQPSSRRWRACSSVAGAQTPPRRTVPVERRPGITGEQLEGAGARARGHYGALAPQNLAKKRPKPPFDLTSTWFVDLTRAFADFRFGPPYPEFYEAGPDGDEGSRGGREERASAIATASASATRPACR